MTKSKEVCDSSGIEPIRQKKPVVKFKTYLSFFIVSFTYVSLHTSAFLEYTRGTLTHVRRIWVHPKLTYNLEQKLNPTSREHAF